MKIISVVLPGRFPSTIMGNTTVGNENNNEFSPIKIARIAIYILIFLVGSFGNLLVMIVVRARGKRRIFHDYFLLNLAIADLLYILCLPADIYIEIAEFPFTPVYCKLIYPLTTFAYSLSILTLTAMAIGRCYIMQGTSRPPIKDRTAFLCIAFLWILSVICVLPLSITARSSLNACLEEWPSTSYRRAYTIALLVLQYIGPLVIIGFAYVYIGVFRIHKKQARLQVNVATHKIISSIRQRNIQIVRTLAVIVILFALLMLPHEIAWMMIDFGNEKQKNMGFELVKYSPILTYLHSCSNPLVYGLMISQFRTDMKKCLCCGRLDSLPGEDDHGSTRNQSHSAREENERLNVMKSNTSSFFGRQNTFCKPLITEISRKNRGCHTRVKEDAGNRGDSQLL